MITDTPGFTALILGGATLDGEFVDVADEQEVGRRTTFDVEHAWRGLPLLRRLDHERERERPRERGARVRLALSPRVMRWIRLQGYVRSAVPNEPFELALFASDLAVVREAVAGGVAIGRRRLGERGKEVRQADGDTEINSHTVDDLRAAREATPGAPALPPQSLGAGNTPDEVETALAAGADELLLPMVRTAAEVESVLDQVGGRAGPASSSRPWSAVAAASELACLPLSRVYVGLNDLSIARGTPTIFAPLADGLLDELRERFAGSASGSAGLTLPEAGAPVPCRLLVGEMARLRAGFTFLRRSFYRDVRAGTPRGRSRGSSVPRAALRSRGRRRPRRRDRDELLGLAGAPGRAGRPCLRAPSSPASVCS